jgi:hypothetical protein
MKTQKPIYFKVPISTYTTQKQLGKKKTHASVCMNSIMFLMGIVQPSGVCSSVIFQ